MSSTSSITHEIISTFLASVRSVGTACTLAGVGIYLHQQGYVVNNGKRTLALISQQVTIPLLFFTKILYCNQDWSDDPCPNITDSLRDVWILLLWPLYVCGAGLLVGYGISKLAKVPEQQQSAILVAVGFGNSTGLPITLLTVIHSNFPSSTNMGRVDPTLFLSVYLLLYPVLQWGIGGWLLAPPEKTREEEKSKPMERIDSMPNPHEQALVRALRKSSQRATHLAAETWHKESHRLAHNVLNRSNRMPIHYQIAHRGLDTLDASLYMSVQENLNRYGQPVFGTNGGSGNNSPTTYTGLSSSPPAPASHDSMLHVESIGMDLSANVDLENGGNGDNSLAATPTTPTNDGLALIQEDASEPPLVQAKQFAHPMSSSSSMMMDKDGNHVRNDSNTTHTELFHAMKRDSTGALNDKPGIHPGNGHNGGYGSLPRNDDDAGETTKLLALNETNGKSPHDSESTSSSSYEEEHLCRTCAKVVQRCFQPPVVGALLGLFIASFPALRGIFVDIIDRTGDAPLEWFFDGLYTTGQAAVPINMMILGCNLSASYMLDAHDESNAKKFFSKQVSMAVVVGKMIIMPIIGYISAFLMQYIYPVPDEIAGSFYLVLLIVFLCPTANNVMVMVELSGNGSKEGMARIIAYQYMVAPIILSLTVTGSVLMATSFSSNGSMAGDS